MLRELSPLTKLCSCNASSRRPMPQPTPLVRWAINPCTGSRISCESGGPTGSSLRRARGLDFDTLRSDDGAGCMDSYVGLVSGVSRRIFPMTRHATLSAPHRGWTMTFILPHFGNEKTEPIRNSRQTKLRIPGDLLDRLWVVASGLWPSVLGAFENAPCTLYEPYAGAMPANNAK